VFLGDRKLELREFQDPTSGPRDVVLEIKASGMCGSDLHNYRAPAQPAGAVTGGIRRQAGMIAGHEPCGVVAAVDAESRCARLPWKRLTVVARGVMVDAAVDAEEATDDPVAQLNDYEVRHLPTHLAAAGRISELVRLLDVETSQRRNAWYLARVRGDPSGAGYLADVALARRLASAVGLRARLVLFESSVRSVASGVPPELLQRLVASGRWTPTDALNAVRGMEDPRQRRDALLKVLPRLDGEVRAAAWEMLKATSAGALDLAEAVESLPEDLRLVALRYGLSVARASGPGWARDSSIVALTLRFPDGALAEAVAAIPMLVVPRSRADAIAGLAERLPDGLLRRALTEARAIGDAGERARALTAIAPRLARGDRSAVLREALREGQRGDDRRMVVHVLCIQARHGPSRRRRAALAQARRIARSLRDPMDMAWALKCVAQAMGGAERRGMMERALSAARAASLEWDRAQAISWLIGDLPVDLLQKELLDLRSIAGNDSRRHVLVALIDHLPERLLGKALAEARHLGAGEHRAMVIERLGPRLPPNLLRDALASGLAIRDERQRANAICALAPRLEEPLLGRALAAVAVLRSEEERSRGLAAIGPRLPERLIDDALSIARSMQSGWHRARALSAISETVALTAGTTLLDEAIASAREIADVAPRADALIRLAAEVSPGRRPWVREHALACIRSMPRGCGRVTALIESLSTLAASERERLLTEALEDARRLVEPGERSECLRRLAGYLPHREAALVLDEALAVVARIRGDRGRADALRRFAPTLRGEQLDRALDIARRIKTLGVRVEAISVVASRLPASRRAPILARALVGARSIEGGSARARGLSSLAAGLTADRRPRVLAQAAAAAREPARLEARVEPLVAVAARTSGRERAKLLAEALAAANAIKDALSRGNALRTVAASLPPNVARDAVTAARLVDDPLGRARALRVLVARVTERERQQVAREALDAIGGIGDEWNVAGEIDALLADLPDDLLGAALTLVLSRAPGATALPLARLAVRWPAACRSAGIPEHVAVSATLDAFARGRRPQALAAISAVIPVLRSLGGVAVLDELAQALVDTATWWP
jgi:Alcohol dehydrogenase GroES-like domain